MARKSYRQYSYPRPYRETAVDLPPELVSFFRNRGAAMSSRRDRKELLPSHGRYIQTPNVQDAVAVSYVGIEGGNPEEVPYDVVNDLDSIDYPFTNPDVKDKAKADEITREALAFLFGPGGYTDIQKAYMLNTNTIPVRVAYRDKGKRTKLMYVKRPDTNRIIGKYLYGIISGLEQYNWGFNRAVFIEEEVSGSLLADLNEREYLENPEYKKGIIRAVVHSDFLALHDTAHPRNRIIDSGMQTVFFDFNIMFGKKDHRKNELLDEYVGLPGFMDTDIFDEYFKEKRDVRKRVSEHRRSFEKFVRLIGGLRDRTGKTLDERMQRFYDGQMPDRSRVRSIEEYFERKIDSYVQDSGI
ncbi:hypothetical protein JW707_02260 [Candidatus Woesearchaeota archaeon]|nr:hypothetical protein [Candidatus Woesearchaeota archaeon]